MVLRSVKRIVSGGLVGVACMLLSTTGASAQPMDACQVIGSDEASTYAGVAYDAGAPIQMDNGSTGCAYHAGTTSVLTIIVAQAPDTDTAQAQWADYAARAQALVTEDLPPGTQVNLIPNDVNDLPADRAAIATGTGNLFGQSLNASACYLLKGTTFVGFTEIARGQSTPAPADVEVEALNVLGRMP